MAGAKIKQENSDVGDFNENSTMVIGSDSWLRHCVVKMEEHEHDRKDIIKLESIYQCNENAKNVTSSSVMETQSSCNREEKNNEAIARRSAIDQIRTSVLDKASVSESAASGLCTFQCPECSATYTNWRCCYLHMKDKHKCTVSFNDYWCYLSNATIHVCKICSEKLICDTRLMSCHFTKKHKLSLADYRMQYSSDCNMKTNHQTNHQFKRLLESGKVSFHEIGNLCKFRCPKCKGTFSSLDWLAKHARKKCKLSVSNQNVIKYVTKVVSHKCKLCSKLVLCDGKLLATHFLAKHRIKSLKEYANKTGSTMAAADGCKKQSFEKLTNTAKLSQQVGSMCRFSCDQCNYESKTWAATRKHMQKIHSWSSNESWSNYISKTVMHQCRICQKKVLNDVVFLFNHFKDSHKMTLLSYVKKYKVVYMKNV